MNEELYNKLSKALQRNERKSDYYQNKYSGKEETLTFYGGWSSGYWQGRVSALEEVLDLLEDYDMKPKIDIADLIRKKLG